MSLNLNFIQVSISKTSRQPYLSAMPLTILGNNIDPASSPGSTVTVACRCVGIAWRTQSETRGRAWQKMQKKVYDSTKK